MEPIKTQSDPINQKPIEDLGLNDIAEKRRLQIAAKQKRFNLIMLILKIAALVIIAGVVAVKLLNKALPPELPPVVVQNPADNTITTPQETIESPWKIYKSEELKLFLKYPSEALIRDTTAPNRRIELTYQVNMNGTEDIDDTNLTEGYIFRVTPLSLGLRTFSEIVQIKKDSYQVKCPTTAQFGEIYTSLVDTVDAMGFTIENCDGDYIVTYVPRFGTYYEFVQIYKGNLGVRQKYKSTTDEILQNFRFFPEGQALPEGPFKTFIDDSNKMLFIHPNLDESCCTFTDPSIKGIRFIVALGDKDTYLDANRFDGIAFYIVNSYGESLQSFVDAQKAILVEDYKVVKGTEPQGDIINTKVGQYEAILLKGFSWRGDTLVFANSSKVNQTLVIVIKNISGIGFDEKVKTILESVEYF